VKGKKKRRRGSTPGEILGPRVHERVVVIIISLLPFLLYYRFVFGGQMLYGSDWLISGYTARDFIAKYLASHGRLPLWHPYVFGGLPTVAAFLGDIFYPTLLFRVFVPVRIVWSYTFAVHIALAGIGTYYFLRYLNLHRYAAVVGAISYMFCGSIVSMTSPGHDAKMICASLLPLALFFFAKAIDTGKLYRFMLAGTVVAFSFLAGHVQMTYYMLLVLFAFLLFKLFEIVRKEGGKKYAARVGLFSVLAALFVICFISVQYLPVYKYIGFAARGGERGYLWATSWSLPTAELLDLLTPHFSGLGVKYWGTNYFKLDSQYLGILPLVLAPLALLGKRPRNVKFFIGLALVGMLLALGGHTPFYRLAYYLVPGIKKFRGPAMVFYVTSFSVAVLAAFGASRVMDELKEVQWKRMKIYLIGAVVAVLLFLLVSAAAREPLIRAISGKIGPYLSSQYSAAVAAQRISNLKSNYPTYLKGLAWASFLVALNAGLLFLLALKRISRSAWGAAVGLFLVADLWIVWVGGESPFIRSAPLPSVYYAEDEVASFLKRQEGLFRVFPFRYDHMNDNYLMHYGIESVGGYHGNQLQSYQDFIGAGKSVMFNAPNLENQNFLDLLNVKYIVSVVLPRDVAGFDARTREAIESIRAFFERDYFNLVYSGRVYAIYENRRVLERATLVPGCEVLPREEILDRLKEETFKPGGVVVLEEDPGLALEGGGGPAGVVRVIEYGPNRIILETESTKNSILLLSENYYDQWRARVDGKNAKIFRANYTQRAVPLGAGSHTIQMEYDSPAMKLGALLSILSFLVFAASVVLWRKDARTRTGKGGGNR
jgi:hypothetical protein